MNLEFTFIDNVWVATFTATDDFAIHIEKEGKAPVYFKQSCVEGATPDLIKSIKMDSAETVLDCAICYPVYPLYMTVMAYEKPTMAIVTVKA